MNVNWITNLKRDGNCKIQSGSANCDVVVVVIKQRAPTDCRHTIVIRMVIEIANFRSVSVHHGLPPSERQQQPSDCDYIQQTHQPLPPMERMLPFCYGALRQLSW